MGARRTAVLCTRAGSPVNGDLVGAQACARPLGMFLCGEGRQAGRTCRVGWLERDRDTERKRRVCIGDTGGFLLVDFCWWILVFTGVHWYVLRWCGVSFFLSCFFFFCFFFHRTCHYRNSA